MSNQIDPDRELYVPFPPGFKLPNVQPKSETIGEFEKRIVGEIAKAFEIPMHLLLRRAPDILMELEPRADGMKIYSVRHGRYETRIVTRPEALTPFLDGYTFT